MFVRAGPLRPPRPCASRGYPPVCVPDRVKKKENDKDEDLKEEERELKDRRCFQCGDPGHVRRDCPEYRHLKQRAAAATGSLQTLRCRLSASSLAAGDPVLRLVLPSSRGAEHGELPVPPHGPGSCGRSREDQADL